MVQAYDRKNFQLIIYTERQVRIAIEKMKWTEGVSLHVDTTGNLVKKLGDSEVFLTSCVFRGMLPYFYLLQRYLLKVLGKDERSDEFAPTPSLNHPPLVIADMLSLRTTTEDYRHFMAKWYQDMQEINSKLNIFMYLLRFTFLFT